MNATTQTESVPRGNGRTVYRAGGIPVTTGVHHGGHADDLPTVKETRELSRLIDGSSRAARCGRPGRRGSPERRSRLMTKLNAAVAAGRGIQNLSRDELETLIGMLDERVHE